MSWNLEEFCAGGGGLAGAGRPKAFECGYISLELGWKDVLLASKQFFLVISLTLGCFWDTSKPRAGILLRALGHVQYPSRSQEAILQYLPQFRMLSAP